MQFNNMLLVSDLDGTLIGRNMKVPNINIHAIQEFTKKGGLFACATGRTELNAVPFMEGLPKDNPWILYNGSALYDFNKNEFIKKNILDDDLIRPLIDKVSKELNLNIQIFTGGAFYVLEGEHTDNLLEREKQNYIKTTLEKIPKGWFKVLFHGDNAPLDELTSLIESYYNDKLHYMRSSSVYLEITPKGVNKGSALLDLKEILKDRVHTVATIGDFGNDVELLQLGDISAAPENAHPSAKNVAKYMVCDVDEGAVADFIGLIEKL